MVKRKSKKYNDILNLILIIVALFLINIISQNFYIRIDLTNDKRFTLSNVSKKILKNLDDIVFVKVYLDGDLPVEFDKFRKSIKETLDEFRVIAKSKLQYEFINPSESSNPKTRNDIYRQLYKEGLRPVDIKTNDKNELSSQIIWPGAIITYKNKSIAVNLLKTILGAPTEFMINSSIENLEYELVNSIAKLTQNVSKRIAFIEGHGELTAKETADITKKLKEFYFVDRIKINGKLNSLKDYDAIIIAKPDSSFSEKDKFVIDQFLMNGGKILWLIDVTTADMDSLKNARFTLVIPKDINLDDMLFKYGARINKDLVLDLRSSPLPIVTGYIGDKAKQELLPWHYFPLSIPFSHHPIVNNVDAIQFKFVSTIDTVSTNKTKKTILLSSSKYSRTVNVPARVSFNILRFKPEAKLFNKEYLPLAVLLEGKFTSLFTNRIPSIIENSKEIKFKSESKDTKMIIVADGDIIRNDINENKIYPLGYDKFTNQQYGNKDFILNAINYLCDNSGLIQIRGKTYPIRLLDKTRIENEKTKWQIINTIIPILIIFLIAFIINYIRKKKFIY